MNEPNPDEQVQFKLKSSIRAPHRDGPWLLLFQPDIPEGWVAGRIEITTRGNVQLEIKPKRGGA